MNGLILLSHALVIQGLSLFFHNGLINLVKIFLINGAAINPASNTCHHLSFLPPSRCSPKALSVTSAAFNWACSNFSLNFSFIEILFNTDFVLESEVSGSTLPSLSFFILIASPLAGLITVLSDMLVAPSSVIIGLLLLESLLISFWALACLIELIAFLPTPSIPLPTFLTPPINAPAPLAKPPKIIVPIPCSGTASCTAWAAACSEVCWASWFIVSCFWWNFIWFLILNGCITELILFFTSGDLPLTYSPALYNLSPINSSALFKFLLI